MREYLITLCTYRYKLQSVVLQALNVFCTKYYKQVGLQKNYKIKILRSVASFTVLIFKANLKTIKTFFSL